MDGDGVPLDLATLRRIVMDATGVDPGALTATDRLEDRGLSGPDRLVCISVIEHGWSIDFPADLLTAIETVGDLIHFTEVKTGQGERL